MELSSDLWPLDPTISESYKTTHCQGWARMGCHPRCTSGGCIMRLRRCGKQLRSCSGIGGASWDGGTWRRFWIGWVCFLFMILALGLTWIVVVKKTTFHATSNFCAHVFDGITLLCGSSYCLFYGRTPYTANWIRPPSGRWRGGDGSNETMMNTGKYQFLIKVLFQAYHVSHSHCRYHPVHLL